jgi:HEAT repeat protein
MGRWLWVCAFLVAFVLGLAAGRAAFKGPSAADVTAEETVSRLQQQIGTLQARLRARENLGPARPGEGNGSVSASSSSVAGTPLADRIAAAAIAESPIPASRPARPETAASVQASTASATGSRVPAAAVEAALDRFYRYIEVTNGAEGRERWQQARDLIQDLRGMGAAAVQALMQVLSAGADSEERRAAARMLGTLQANQALPLFKDILEKEDDLLLRRAAAFGLRQLQTPDAVPMMERILGNAGEDRFVRMSAAYGLAQSGRAAGVNGLVQIFEESTADGRGREMAFRSLTSLNDERAVPFMRQLVTSQAEPGYRLRAIQYLSSQGDRQSLATLQAIIQSPSEQASIRDAATQAYSVINSR